jgi:hypothetical protein
MQSTTICQKCGNANRSTDSTCLKCGNSLVNSPLPTPNLQPDFQKPKQRVWAYVLIGLFILGAIGNAIREKEPRSSYSSVSSSSLTTSPTPDYGTPLELLSYRAERGYSFITIHGEVKNISSEKMEDVAAIVEFRDKSGTLIKSDEGIIEYNPIMPGQTSPFTVMSSDNPLMTNYHVAFKHIFGDSIPFKDSVKPPATGNKRK